MEQKSKVITTAHTNVRFTGDDRIVTVYFNSPVYLPVTEQEAVERYEMNDEHPTKMLIEYFKKSTLVFVVVIPRSNITCITMEPVRRVYTKLSH